MNFKRVRFQLTVAALLMGFFFLGLSFLFQKFSVEPESGTRLATVTVSTGKVELIRAGLTRRIKVDGRNEVSHLDSVETFEVGVADLVFENGYSVRLFENSLTTLERIIDGGKNFHVVLILKRGEIQVDHLGRKGELLISKNGQSVDAAAYNDSELKKVPVKTNPRDNFFSEESTVGAALSVEEITSTMEINRGNFFRCYTRLVQKKVEIKGEAILAFTIASSGKVTMVEVQTQMEPKFVDGEFNKCLKEAVQRIRFRSFLGPAISTIFPLKFD